MSTRKIRIPDWKEDRRYRALELKRAGWIHEEIADALGVSKRAVSRWMKAVHEEGKRVYKLGRVLSVPQDRDRHIAWSTPGMWIVTCLLS